MRNRSIVSRICDIIPVRTDSALRWTRVIRDEIAPNRKEAPCLVLSNRREKSAAEITKKKKKKKNAREHPV